MTATLAQQCRAMGEALECHPVAHGTISHTEAAGAKLREAAAALESQAQQIANSVAALQDCAAENTAGKLRIFEQAQQIEQLQEQYDVAANEVGRLMAVAGPSGKSLGELEAINDDLVAANERLGAALDAVSDAWNKRNEQQARHAGRNPAPWEQCQEHARQDRVWACTVCLERMRAERDRLRDSLIACRPAVRAYLMQYERTAEKMSGPARVAVDDEIAMLSALLDTIDAAAERRV